MDLRGGNHEVNMWLPHAAHTVHANLLCCSINTGKCIHGNQQSFQLNWTQRSPTSLEPIQREKTAAAISGYQWSM